jgi:Tfp pilus assembly protein PilF
MNCIRLIPLLTIIITIHSAAQVPAIKNLSAEAREQFIQKALQLRQNEQFAAAINQLDSILLCNPADAGALLFMGDLQLQHKLYKKAAATYQLLLPLYYEVTTTRINLSYALFMNHHPATALQYAKKAWEQDSCNINAIVNYFNAQLWNIKTNTAKRFLQQQQHLLPAAQVLVLKARLATTSGDYKNGLNFYDSLVTTYPGKYYVQEYADVLLGKKEMEQSAAILQQNKALFSANEYAAAENKAKAARQQNAGTGFVYFKDIAGNTRIENFAWWQQGEGRRYRFSTQAGIASVSSAQNEKTSTQFAHVTINERWNRAWSGQTDLHIQRIQPSGSTGFTGITGKQTIRYQPNDRRMIGLQYSADILNFTASLLQKNIRSNSVGYVTHLMLSGKTGFYSQGSLGVLSDKNSNLQFFGSLYHVFKTEPLLKTGINFTALHYADSSIKGYFAPNRYLGTELFTDYSTAIPGFPALRLQVQAAAGMQQVERQQWQSSRRLQCELALRLAHFESSLKYQTSNVAASTGSGYQFDWITARVAWNW